MKVIALLLATLSFAAAFAPATFVSRSSTALSADKTLAESIFGLDLFAPVADQNDYGARFKKNLKTGQITSSSYVPNGLTAAQYAKIRAEEEAKKDKKYKERVAKAGKFDILADWLKKRGDKIGEGHTYAKLKYSDNDGKKFDGRA